MTLQLAALIAVTAALIAALIRLYRPQITRAALWLASAGHGPHSRPISRPHPLRQRHRGAQRRRAAPRPAPAQADTTREAVAA